MRIAAGLTLIGVLAWAAPADANLYQCKNRDGSVRYQQTPCGVGAVGTRLETRSPSDSTTGSSGHKVTWGEVRRAKSQCDETARRSYPGDDPRRNRERVSCMERVERACGDNKRNSYRCRNEVRRMERKVSKARTSRSRHADRGDLELQNAKATCHAWSANDLSHRTRSMRGQACQALANACNADRNGPECRERIRQLRPR